MSNFIHKTNGGYVEGNNNNSRTERSNSKDMNGFELAMSEEQKPKTDKPGGLVKAFKSAVNFFIRRADEKKDAKALKSFDSGFHHVIDDIRKGKIGFETLSAFMKMEDNSLRAAKGPKEEFLRMATGNSQIRNGIGKHDPEVLKLQLKEQVKNYFEKQDTSDSVLASSVNSSAKPTNPEVLKSYNNAVDRFVDALFHAHDNSKDIFEGHHLMNRLEQK